MSRTASNNFIEAALYYAEHLSFKDYSGTNKDHKSFIRKSFKNNEVISLKLDKIDKPHIILYFIEKYTMKQKYGIQSKRRKKQKTEEGIYVSLYKIENAIGCSTVFAKTLKQILIDSKLVTFKPSFRDTVKDGKKVTLKGSDIMTYNKIEEDNLNISSNKNIEDNELNNFLNTMEIKSL